MLDFVKTHWKKLLLLFCAVVLLSNLYDLQIRHTEKEMRANLKKQLDTINAEYQQLQSGSGKQSMEEIYDDCWEYYRIVYVWYAYLQKHDRILLRDTEIVESWMCYGQTAEGMKDIFADALQLEEKQPEEFLANVNPDNIKTIQNGIDYLEEGNFYISFDSYNQRMLLLDAAQK